MGDYTQWNAQAQLGSLPQASLGQLQQLIQPYPTSHPAFLKEQPMPDGTKPLVVCDGLVTEAKDMDEAQRMAEEQAHQKSANAYILKPVKRIAPKRETVTTDLP